MEKMKIEQKMPDCILIYQSRACGDVSCDEAGNVSVLDFDSPFFNEECKDLFEKNYPFSVDETTLLVQAFVDGKLTLDNFYLMLDLYYQLSETALAILLDAAWKQTIPAQVFSQLAEKEYVFSSDFDVLLVNGVLNGKMSLAVLKAMVRKKYNFSISADNLLVSAVAENKIPSSFLVKMIKKRYLFMPETRDLIVQAVLDNKISRRIFDLMRRKRYKFSEKCWPLLM